MTDSWIQVLVIIATILIPVLGCFGFLIYQIADLKTRLTVIETLLEIFGFPNKNNKNGNG